MTKENTPKGASSPSTVISRPVFQRADNRKALESFHKVGARRVKEISFGVTLTAEPIKLGDPLPCIEDVPSWQAEERPQSTSNEKLLLESEQPLLTEDVPSDPVYAQDQISDLFRSLEESCVVGTGAKLIREKPLAIQGMLKSKGAASARQPRPSPAAEAKLLSKAVTPRSLKRSRHMTIEGILVTIALSLVILYLSVRF